VKVQRSWLVKWGQSTFNRDGGLKLKAAEHAKYILSPFNDVRMQKGAAL
jgi:hypothetical protein